MSDSEELMQDQDRIEAYRQLRERTDALGYASVNHALDALDELCPTASPKLSNN